MKWLLELFIFQCCVVVYVTSFVIIGPYLFGLRMMDNSFFLNSDCRGCFDHAAFFEDSGSRFSENIFLTKKSWCKRGSNRGLKTKNFMKQTVFPWASRSRLKGHLLSIYVYVINAPRAIKSRHTNLSYPQSKQLRWVELKYLRLFYLWKQVPLPILP